MASDHSSRPHSEALVRLARLFRILTRLRSRRPGERVGRPQLAEACECSLQTIHRDIELLQAHTPLFYDRAARTYTLPDSGWAYPIVELTLPDVLALALARSAVAAAAFPHAHSAAVALDKVTAGLSPGLKALLADAAAVVQPAPPARDYSRVPFDRLHRAAAERLTIEIDYQSRSGGERSWRRLDPYSLEQIAGRWDLHGWCHRNAMLRTFAPDRIAALRLTDTTFPFREAEWAAFAGAKGIIGGLRGGPELAVDVRFDPAVAPYALEKRWPDGLTVEADGCDGAARLTGAVRGHEGILPEILRWRRHARVLGGPELRARIAEEACALAALYDGPEP